jgi:hypothetical protein
LKQGLSFRIKEQEGRSNLLPTMLCVVMEVSLEAVVAMDLMVAATQVAVDMEIRRIKPGTNFLLVSCVAELIILSSSATNNLILGSWEKKKVPTQHTPMG